MRTLLTTALALALATPALGQEMQEMNPRWQDSGINDIQAVAGIGFGGFTNTYGDSSNIGFIWNVRAGVDFMRYFGGELNYQGSTSDAVTFVTPAGRLPGSHITSDQITADAKAQWPFMVADRLMEPYVIAGLGYGHIGADSSLSAVGVTSSDAAVFPFGVGLSYNLTQMLMVDARYTYNVYTASQGDTWNIGFNVGGRFGLGSY